MNNTIKYTRNIIGIMMISTTMGILSSRTDEDFKQRNYDDEDSEDDDEEEGEEDEEEGEEDEEEGDTDDEWL